VRAQTKASGCTWKPCAWLVLPSGVTHAIVLLGISKIVHTTAQMFLCCFACMSIYRTRKPNVPFRDSGRRAKSQRTRFVPRRERLIGRRRILPRKMRHFRQNDWHNLKCSLLGAFAELRKATISFVIYLSVRTHGTRLLLDGFWWNLIFEFFFRNSVIKI
jgi:hypothetical protein